MRLRIEFCKGCEPPVKAIDVEGSFGECWNVYCDLFHPVEPFANHQVEPDAMPDQVANGCSPDPNAPDPFVANPETSFDFPPGRPDVWTLSRVRCAVCDRSFNLQHNAGDLVADSACPFCKATHALRWLYDADHERDDDDDQVAADIKQHGVAYLVGGRRVDPTTVVRYTSRTFDPIDGHPNGNEHDDQAIAPNTPTHVVCRVCDRRSVVAHCALGLVACSHCGGELFVADQPDVGPSPLDNRLTARETLRAFERLQERAFTFGAVVAGELAELGRRADAAAIKSTRGGPTA